MRSFLIVGGDKRQEHLKKILSDKLCDVFHLRHTADICELDKIGQYSDIILPLPLSKDGLKLYSDNGLHMDLEFLYGQFQPYHRVYGGNVKETLVGSVFDFLKDKTFKRANAYLTAQGTLRLLLENTDSYIIGKNALIIGFGDVAETLADILSKVGLRVNILARNKNQLLISSMLGYNSLHLSDIDCHIGDADYIFGSVPSTLLGEKQVKLMKNDAVYFELSSAPFTADKKYFEIYSKRYVFGGALPGRYLPMASAELMADFILRKD